MKVAGKSGDWQRRAKGCGLLLVAFVALPFLLLRACQWTDAHPSDSAMIQEFRNNQAIFSELRAMVAQERRVTRIARNFIWIDGMQNVSEAERPNYLPDDRLTRYRTLFNKLKLESGVIRYEDGSVGFLRSSRGMVTSGSSKQFIWSQKLSAPNLAQAGSRSLEDSCMPRTGCGSARQIAPEWFISFESN
ncbi:hypothetical protein [Polymorphobacter sp.]|uniref:hypothetical protein n=1 Tax=Polymorphobacter sp. TaxID=1909290 RepID=UPI003F72CE65